MTKTKEQKHKRRVLYKWIFGYPLLIWAIAIAWIGAGKANPTFDPLLIPMVIVSLVLIYRGLHHE